MIEIISKWAGQLIVALVCVTIIEMLLPDNKIKKYVKTVIGLYIMFCIISPFINQQEFAKIYETTEKELRDIQIETAVSSDKNSSNSIEDLYIQEFKKDVIKQVEGLGYKVNQCDVAIEIDATKENAGINSINLNISNSKLNGQDIEVEDIQKVEVSINNEVIGENKSKSQEETEDTKKIKEFLSKYYEISKEKIEIIQN